MIRELVEREAIAAAAALSSLTDATVGPALRRAAQLLEERAPRRARGERARRGGRRASTLDEGALDRLRLDERAPGDARAPARGDRRARAARAGDREPDARERAAGARAAHSRRHDRGELRGEARSGARHRGAGAEEPEHGRPPHGRRGARTVETLVDEVLRPALEAEGIDPGAVGLVRSPDRSGAEALVSLPQLDSARDPARQRRLDRGARAPRGRPRRAHARPRRGRRRPLRPRLRPSGARGGDRRRQPRPARGLQPAQPRARRPGGGRAGGRARRRLRGARRRGRRDGPCRRRRAGRAAGRADRLRVGGRRRSASRR